MSTEPTTRTAEPTAPADLSGKCLVTVYTNDRTQTLALDPEDLEEFIARCGWTVVDRFFQWTPAGRQRLAELDAKGVAALIRTTEDALAWWKARVIPTPELKSDVARLLRQTLTNTFHVAEIGSEIRVTVPTCREYRSDAVRDGLNRAISAISRLDLPYDYRTYDAGTDSFLSLTPKQQPADAPAAPAPNAPEETYPQTIVSADGQTHDVLAYYSAATVASVWQALATQMYASGYDALLCVRSQGERKPRWCYRFGDTYTAAFQPDPDYMTRHLAGVTPDDAPRCAVCKRPFSAQEARAGYTTCEHCPAPPEGAQEPQETPGSAAAGKTPRTFEDGRHAARTDYAEMDSTCRGVRAWARNELKHEGTDDYSRGYLAGLRESLDESDRAAEEQRSSHEDMKTVVSDTERFAAVRGVLDAIQACLAESPERLPTIKTLCRHIFPYAFNMPDGRTAGEWLAERFAAAERQIPPAFCIYEDCDQTADFEGGYCPAHRAAVNASGAD